MDDTLKALLRAAWDAGRERGETEAAAYEWGMKGSRASMGSRDEAFADFLETLPPPPKED